LDYWCVLLLTQLQKNFCFNGIKMARMSRRTKHQVSHAKLFGVKMSRFNIVTEHVTLFSTKCMSRPHISLSGITIYFWEVGTFFKVLFAVLDKFCLKFFIKNSCLKQQTFYFGQNILHQV